MADDLRRACVTLVTNDDFALGARALVRSLGHSGTGGDIVVMHTAGVGADALRPLVDLGATAVLSLLAFIALNCMIGAYKSGEAGIVAPMQYSQIIWATLYGSLFFGEVPDGRTFAGVALIVASGVYIVLRESRAKTSKNTPVLRTRGRVIAGPNIRISPDQSSRDEEPGGRQPSSGTEENPIR